MDGRRGQPVPRGNSEPPVGRRLLSVGALRTAAQRDARVEVEDPRRRGRTLKIDESIVATRTGAEWSNAKNERSRRTIPIDEETIRAFARAEPNRRPRGWLWGASGRTTI